MKKEDNPFIVKGSKLIYENPWIKVREDSVIRPGGKDGIFGVVEMRPGVTVVALDADRFVYLVREYKYALERYSLECISGALDNGEDVLSAAKRELREEIGGASTEWNDLGHVDPFTGVVKSTNYIYFARNIVIDSSPSPDEGEVLCVVRLPFAEVYAKVSNGEITHAASVAAILKTNILLNQ